MGIQSSINSLLSQAQRLATFYRGFDTADDIILNQEIAKNEDRIRTDIEAGNAPMKDGKVDPEWLKKRRYEYERNKFNDDGTLSRIGEKKARLLQYRIDRGFEPNSDDKNFLNDPRVQEYLKSQATNSELKNKVASDLARASVEARTASINKTKSNFNEHTASLIRYYGKGSGNP